MSLWECWILCLLGMLDSVSLWEQWILCLLGMWILDLMIDPYGIAVLIKRALKEKETQIEKENIYRTLEKE